MVEISEREANLEKKARVTAEMPDPSAVSPRPRHISAMTYTTFSTSQAQFGEIFITDRMLRSGERDATRRGYRIPVLQKAMNPQVLLERVNVYLAREEIALQVSGLSVRKQRAAMRKITKKVNKEFGKYGISVSR